MPGLVEFAFGMLWLTLLAGAGKYCGPEIEPVGPMIWSTSLGLKLLTCTGRSNVKFIDLVVPLSTRLSFPVPVGTVVLVTYGPGMISGSVF